MASRKCGVEARLIENGQWLGPTAALLVSSAGQQLRRGESGVMSMADFP